MISSIWHSCVQVRFSDGSKQALKLRCFLSLPPVSFPPYLSMEFNLAVDL